MRRKSLKGIIFVALLMAAVFVISSDKLMPGMSRTAYADELKSGDYKYVILEDETVRIVKYAGKATKVIFPSTLAGKRVSQIQSYEYSVFEDNHKEKVTSAEIPEGVIEIGDTFNGCTKLKSVILPGSLLRIETDFGNCTSLTEIKLPAKLEYIGNQAFWGCTGLREINIPDSVIEMGDGAFYHCTNLKKLKLSKNAPVVDLYGCEFLINLIIPNGVTEITLSDCFRLNKLNLPGSLKKLSISNNDSLESCTIPEGIEVISLWSCKRLIKVNIPSSTIDVVLKYCPKIKSIKLPNTLTYIKDEAFLMCKSLEDINIPSSVRSVGENSLLGTAWYNKQKDGLIYKDKWCIAYKGDRAKVKSLSFVKGTKGIVDGLTAERELMILSNGSLLSDLRPFHALSDIMLPDSVEFIGSRTFSDCKNLTSITLSPNIKTISAYAFEGCSKIKSIVLPDRMEMIEEGAFIGCTNLTNVKFSKQLKVIEPGAFVSCSKIKSIVLPDSLEIIGRDMRDDEYEGFFGVFTGCESLTSITLSKNLKLIGYRTFEDCVNLKNIVLPNKLESIGASAFKGCVKLDTFALPKSLQRIGEEAFENTAWMKKQKNGVIHKDGWIIDYKGTIPSGNSYTVEEGVAGIADYVPLFIENSKLTKVQLPKSLMYIGKSAFKKCVNLTTINLPEGLLKIWDSAFFGCKKLDNIVLPKSLVSLGKDAFYDCRLSSIVILNKDMEIGSNAIGYYTGKDKYGWDEWYKIYDGLYGRMFIVGYLDSTADAYAKRNELNFMVLPKGRSELPKGAAEIPLEDLEYEDFGDHLVITKYKGAGSNNTLVLPRMINYKKVTDIGEGAFSGCSTITNIMMPRGIERIGDRAFSNCSNLRSVELLGDERDIRVGVSQSLLVTGMGEFAFADCSNLKSIQIPEGIMEIGDGAFSKCSGLTDIALPKGLHNIGDYVFSGCSSLLNVVIPEGITSIGTDTFYGCQSLTSVMLPKNVKYISGSAFSGCSSLKEIKLPESLTRLGDYAFSGCRSLTSITVPKGVKTIEEGTFADCTSLKRIEISEDVTLISDYVFAGCTSLTDLVIPRSVTGMGEDVFGLGDDTTGEGCINLRSITYLGECPKGINNSLIPPGCTVHYKPEYAASWKEYQYNVKRDAPVQENDDPWNSDFWDFGEGAGNGEGEESDSGKENSYDISLYADEVLRLVNEARSKEGLSPLTTDTALQEAANQRAIEQKQLFSHTRPDGQSCFTVLEEYDITYISAGENIACGHRTAQAVMEGWMNSAGHRANILEENFGLIGIGVYEAEGVIYWVQLFVRSE